MIGTRVGQVEDVRLLRGEGTFVGDIRIPNLAHAAILRSPYAHARIKRIEASTARSMEGVLAVVTWNEIASSAKPIPQTMPHPNLHSQTPYPLARDIVRFVGEPVAMVVADDQYLAKVALRFINVEYEPLDPVIDTEEALKSSSPRVHDSLPDNIAGQFGQQIGNLEEALANAPVILQERITIGRYSAQSLETRGLIAMYQPNQDAPTLTVWWSNQGPHNARRILSDQLGLSSDQVRVIVPNVGGGFGVKNRYYPEDTLVALIAMQLQRPVKWLEDRWESFIGTYQAGEQIHDVTLGLDSDGKILALIDHFIYDQGAYTPLGVVVPYITSVSIPGPYQISNYKVDCTMVFTNKTPTAPYRGAGKPQATFVMERMLDLGARALNIDPVDIRRRNLLEETAFPYNTGLTDLDNTTVTYDSGSYTACLERSLELIGYADFPRQKLIAKNKSHQIGMGIACFIEMTGRGPFEGACIRIEPSGRVIVRSGIASQGQSHQTTLAQVCASILGTKFEDISVEVGDTAGIALGIGTFAGRTAVMAGNAVAEAAKAVREKVLGHAAHILNVSQYQLDVFDSRVRVQASPDKSVTFAEIARHIANTSAPNANSDKDLEATCYYHSNRPAYTNGTYAVIVEVNSETGAVKILKHAMVYDCGVQINPQAIEGQIQGGVAQGISGILFEEFRYGEDGAALSTSFQNYLLSTSADIPFLQLDHKETPSPFNPLGVKGVGECGTIPTPAAVIAAVEDALGGSIHITCAPLSPQKLHKIIHAY